MSHITKSINKMPASIYTLQSTNTLQLPVITPESYKLMSNHLHGCKLSRDFAMDGEYMALTFTSICSLRT